MISAYIEYQGISKQFETSSSELKQEFCAMPMVRRFGVAVIFRIAPRKSPYEKYPFEWNCTVRRTPLSRQKTGMNKV
jgi:hypothetical protein